MNSIPVGDALLGRVIDAAGEPVDGQGPIDAVIRLPLDRPVGADVSVLPDQMLETGVKVIDLYAPIVRGGTIPMIAGSGVGKVVVSNELIQRVATRHGGRAVMAFLDHPTYGMAELLADIRSSGMERHAALLVGQPDDSQPVRAQIGLAALTLAESFCDQGHETLLFMEENLVSDQTVERFLTRRHGDTRAALTILLWQHDPPIMPAGARVYSQLLRDGDGQLVFSRALAKQSIWPAIDPVQSASRLLGGQALTAEHIQVARAAEELLRDHGNLEGTGAAGDDARLQARARRVLLFGSQPFFVAEIFTAVPGVYVPIAETVRGYGELVDGRHDDVPEDAFRFVGAIEEALGKAAG
jgi:F-type H+-transporting ATPase subunit beta